MHDFEKNINFPAYASMGLHTNNTPHKERKWEHIEENLQNHLLNKFSYIQVVQAVRWFGVCRLYGSYELRSRK